MYMYICILVGGRQHVEKMINSKLLSTQAIVLQVDHFRQLHIIMIGSICQDLFLEIVVFFYIY